jgi:predicted metal-dependent peptidase
MMDKAKTRMLFKHLFFATVIVSTPFIETKRYPRAATNMKVVYWNPDFFATLTLEVVMFVIAHEIFHILLKHGLRRLQRDPEIWNCACDYYINAKLKEYGYTLWQYVNPDGTPGGCLYDAKYDGMYEEQIYALLLTESKSNPQPEEGGGSGDEEGESEEGESEEGESGGDEGKPGKGKPGFTKGGLRKDGLGDDLTDEGVNMNDPMERAKIEREIDATIARALTIARQAGKMPAGLELLMEGVINPPQPWFALFVDFMTRMVNDEDSWNRRNRRIDQFVLPGRRNPGMGPVGVIGDTSGSMLEYNVFPQVGEEIDYMMQTAKPEFVQVIWADHEDASYEERFEPGDMVVLHPHGGGGTDMRLPLKKMEEYEPDICVLITDAETPFPDEPTPFPLIILTTTGQETPSWATTIRIR